MNTAHSTDEEPEITLGSYLKYFVGMWILGIKMIFKALIGWIMVCLMLGLPAFAFQFIAVIQFPSEQAKQIVTLLAFGAYFLIAAPLAFYVGGSTVGFCPWISAATFTKQKKS